MQATSAKNASVDTRSDPLKDKIQTVKIEFHSGEGKRTHFAHEYKNLFS